MATAPIETLSLPQPTLPERLEDSEEYRHILAMTQRLFPGSVGVRRKQDPEFWEEYLVFHVRAHGTLERVMTSDREWHRECRRLAPSAPQLYRLALRLDDGCE